MCFTIPSIIWYLLPIAIQCQKMHVNSDAILTVLGVHMESREAFVSHVRLLKRPRSMSSWYSMSLHGMYHSNQYMIEHP